MKFNGFGVIAHLRDIGSIELLATSSQVMPVYCDERPSWDLSLELDASTGNSEAWAIWATGRIMIFASSRMGGWAAGHSGVDGEE